MTIGPLLFDSTKRASRPERGSTLTATNHYDQRHNLVKFVQRCREFRDFLIKSTPPVFHMFISVAVMV